MNIKPLEWREILIPLYEKAFEAMSPAYRYTIIKSMVHKDMWYMQIYLNLNNNMSLISDNLTFVSLQDAKDVANKHNTEKAKSLIKEWLSS